MYTKHTHWDMPCSSTVNQDLFTNYYCDTHSNKIQTLQNKIQWCYSAQYATKTVLALDFNPCVRLQSLCRPCHGRGYCEETQWLAREMAGLIDSNLQGLPCVKTRASCHKQTVHVYRHRGVKETRNHQNTSHGVGNHPKYYFLGTTRSCAVDWLHVVCVCFQKYIT